MTIEYQLYRSTEYGLRAQIEAIVNAISARITDDWPIVKNSIAVGEELTIPSGYQLLVYESFDVLGTLTNNGDLVILDETP